MLFTSYQFILFVLIALILYYVAPKRIQWIVLLCMNMLFYLYAGLSGIIFIVTTIITTYAGARLILFCLLILEYLLYLNTPICL